MKNRMLNLKVYTTDLNIVVKFAKLANASLTVGHGNIIGYVSIGEDYPIVHGFTRGSTIDKTLSTITTRDINYLYRYKFASQMHKPSHNTNIDKFKFPGE